jgi:hypothetical protein
MSNSDPHATRLNCACARHVNARQSTVSMQRWHSAIADDIGMRQLQRMRFTSSPSRSVMRAAAAAHHHHP